MATYQHRKPQSPMCADTASTSWDVAANLGPGTSGGESTF